MNVNHKKTPLYQLYKSQERLRHLANSLENSGLLDLSIKIRHEYNVVCDAIVAMGVPLDQSGRWSVIDSYSVVHLI